jgi:hypothetical protein
MHDAWDEYRKRRNVAIFALLGYVPVVFPLAIVAFKLFHTFIPGDVFAGTWMIFFVISGNRVMRFACPRCGKWYFAKWWYHNMFVRHCVHCGLRKYSDPAALVG